MSSFEKLPIELQREILRITINDTLEKPNIELQKEGLRINCRDTLGSDVIVKEKGNGWQLVVNYVLVNSVWFDIVTRFVYTKLHKSFALMRKAGLVRFAKIYAKCISEINLKFYLTKEQDVRQIAQNVQFENLQRLIFPSDCMYSNEIVKLMSPTLSHIESFIVCEHSCEAEVWKGGNAVLKELLEKKSHYYPELKLDLAFDLPMLRLLEKEAEQPPYYYPTVQLRETFQNVMTANDLDIVGRLPGVEELLLFSIFSFDSHEIGNPIRYLLKGLKRLHVFEPQLFDTISASKTIVNDGNVYILVDLLHQLPSIEELGIHIGKAFNTFAITMVPKNKIDWVNLKKFAVTVDFLEPELEKTAKSLKGLLKFAPNIESLTLTVLTEHDEIDCKDLVFLPDLPNLKELSIASEDPLFNIERQLLRLTEKKERGRISMCLSTIIDVNKLSDHIDARGIEDADLIFGNVKHMCGVYFESGEDGLCVHEFISSRLGLIIDDVEGAGVIECGVCEDLWINGGDDDDDDFGFDDENTNTSDGNNEIGYENMETAALLDFLALVDGIFIDDIGF